jgi:hypothetical protein
MVEWLIDFLDRAWDENNREQFRRIWQILRVMDFAKNRRSYPDYCEVPKLTRTGGLQS